MTSLRTVSNGTVAEAVLPDEPEFPMNKALAPSASSTHAPARRAVAMDGFGLLPLAEADKGGAATEPS